jgi:hypothetical protein
LPPDFASVETVHSRVGRRLLVVALASLCLSCEDTSIAPPPNVVFALFDPAATPPQIPLPNDLTMMPAPPSSPAVESFSGPLDPTTIRPDDVIVLDLVAMAPIVGASAVFDATVNRLVIMPPPTGWPIGHRIAIVLRGGDTGLRGVGNIPVVASAAFFFARSPVPLSNCATPAANCVSASPEVLPVEQAIGLERLRQAFAPLFAVLEAQGIPRDVVVIAWTFTVGVAAPVPDAGLPTD